MGKRGQWWRYFCGMARSAPRTPVLLFGLLALYILLQSAWWMWLLLRKDRDLLALQQQLMATGVAPLLPMRPPGHTLLMVLGEGLVFLLLVLLALWITFRTLRHELSLARQQRDFLMAASHELRTPIAALKLHLQTMQRSNLDPGAREQLTRIARNDVERLHALAEQVLLASRLEDHAAPPELARTDVAALVREVLAEARYSYGRDHRFRTDIPESLMVMTSKASIRSILGNLLENACKYAPKCTEVQVSLRTAGHAVQLLVQDKGPGVPVEDRHRIFSKFFRGGDEATRRVKGTGLGLFIVRRLLEDLGGHVDYRPGGSGGSTFTATFPYREKP